VLQRHSGAIRNDGGVLQCDSGAIRNGGGVLQRDSGAVRNDGGVLQRHSRAVRNGGGVLQRDSGAIRNNGGVLQRGEVLKSYLGTKRQNPCQQGNCEGVRYFGSSQTEMQIFVIRQFDVYLHYRALQ